MHHFELALLVKLSLLASLIGLMLVATAVAAVDLVTKTVLWRAALNRELASDWWPAFERDFHYYAASRGATHEQ